MQVGGELWQREGEAGGVKGGVEGGVMFAAERMCIGGRGLHKDTYLQYVHGSVLLSFDMADAFMVLCHNVIVSSMKLYTWQIHCDCDRPHVSQSFTVRDLIGQT